MDRRIFYAICAECANVPAGQPACWQCDGRVFFVVDDEDDADFIIQTARPSFGGFSVSLRATDTLREWLSRTEEPE